VPPLHIGFSFLKNIKISNFGGISKFFKLIAFGQIWADSTTLPVADSMILDGLKTLKSQNSYI
jgi:hypothetical protein